MSYSNRPSSDIIAFLNNYKSKSTSSNNNNNNKTELNLNKSFYKNQSPALPSNLTILLLHLKLKGNYKELEINHNFIQWLFPIREKGMNYLSQPLFLNEIESIINDSECLKLLKESYEIMLDFYGMRLINFKTGEIGRKLTSTTTSSSTSSASTSNTSNDTYKSRYKNLSTSSHNYLRITRILKSLSELSYEHLNAPFLLYFLLEQGQSELNNSSLINSMDGYWKYCIRNKEERDYVDEMIELVRSGKGKWGEVEYKEALKRREETGSFLISGEVSKVAKE